ELARKNAHVFVASRSIERGDAAVESIKEEINNANVEYLPLDLQSLKSVKKAAEFFLDRKLPLHIFKGHYYAPTCGIDFENLNNPNAYSPLERYCQSKLANILFSLELNKRLSDKEVYVNSVHPGIVNTELLRGVEENYGFWVKPLTRSVSNIFFTSPENGALTQLYCATSPEIVEKNLRGLYFVPYAKLEEPSEKSKDEELARKLWEYSENFIDERLKKINEEDN
ncbi:16256_t:CDS:2, partial [Acaulospora colombiana]